MKPIVSMFQVHTPFPKEISSGLFQQIQNILKNHSKILSVKNYKNKKLYFYNKELITEKGYNLYSDIGLFRSIITNMDNQILMVSPSKSVNYEYKEYKFSYMLQLCILYADLLIAISKLIGEYHLNVIIL
jgi:hypothetical protein